MAVLYEGTERENQGVVICTCDASLYAHFFEMWTNLWKQSVFRATER